MIGNRAEAAAERRLPFYYKNAKKCKSIVGPLSSNARLSCVKCGHSAKQDRFKQASQKDTFLQTSSWNHAFLL